jgi:hypothetical protein
LSSLSRETTQRFSIAALQKTRTKTVMYCFTTACIRFIGIFATTHLLLTLQRAPVSQWQKTCPATDKLVLSSVLPEPTGLITRSRQGIMDHGLMKSPVLGRCDRSLHCENDRSTRRAVWGTGFTPKVIWSIVKQAASNSGLSRVAPHDLRRTCAKLCHEAGGELEQIQFLLGHVSVQTTERYLGCKQRNNVPDMNCPLINCCLDPITAPERFECGRPCHSGGRAPNGPREAADLRFSMLLLRPDADHSLPALRALHNSYALAESRCQHPTADAGPLPL